jgi:hypothetical protein
MFISAWNALIKIGHVLCTISLTLLGCIFIGEFLIKKKLKKKRNE